MFFRPMIIDDLLILRTGELACNLDLGYIRHPMKIT